MQCPYCGKEMREGAIISPRDRLLWRENGEGEWIKLCRTPFLDEARVESSYCSDCKMIFTPVPELGDDLLTSLKKKAGTVAADIREKREQNRAEREEEQKEKQREQRRRKDPWED